MKKYLLFVLFIGLSINAQSQIKFLEDFNYTSTGVPADDSLTHASLGGAVWTKHSGTGNNILWSSAGLTYTGYAGSNIGGSVSLAHGSGSRIDVNATVDSIETGSAYASFMLNVTTAGGATGDYFAHFLAGSGAAPGSDFKARLFTKDGGVAGTFKLGISKGSSNSGAVYTTADYNLNQTYLVVLKYTFNASTLDDVCSAYIFASGVPSTEPSTADITATDMTISDIAKIKGFALRQGSTGTGAIIFDGLRVGTDWIYAPLPIKLNSFNAVGLQNQVNLSWLTFSDQTGGSFEVQRSIDGSSFENISTVAANNLGNSSYEITDRNLPSVKTLYYRLKVVNADGKFEYSTIQKVTLKDVKLTVSPNPASNEILINASENIKSVEIFDIRGRRIMLKDNINLNQTRINVTSFGEGSYIVKTLIGSEVSTQQIMVKH
ncbi:MAG: T9SS type A sorting domain-containing protein [Chitinophagaceae bacterium]|nr:T9SS type A sorting domain-containing protein [Chitinophagaceae bacterium]